MRDALGKREAALLGVNLAKGEPSKTEFYLFGDINQRLSDYSAFKNGHLASAGGWHDQDAAWREDMLTLDGMAAEEQAKLVQGRGG